MTLNDKQLEKITKLAKKTLALNPEISKNGHALNFLGRIFVRDNGEAVFTNTFSIVSLRQGLINKNIDFDFRTKKQIEKGVSLINPNKDYFPDTDRLFYDQYHLQGMNTKTMNVKELIKELKELEKTGNEPSLCGRKKVIVCYFDNDDMKFSKSDMCSGFQKMRLNIEPLLSVLMTMYIIGDEEVALYATSSKESVFRPIQLVSENVKGVVAPIRYH